MSKKAKFYKTVIMVEVLHEGERDFGGDLGQVAEEITIGECSGLLNVASVKAITHKQMVKECRKQNTDPEFFGIDEDGNELY